MKLNTGCKLLAIAVIACLSLAAQGVIGGNQNGFGPGGYIPVPRPPILPKPTNAPAGGLVNSLTLPGYDFKLIEISGQPVKLTVDAAPVVVPLTRTVAGTNVLGFVATFTLNNQTGVDRTFDFAAAYYASLRVGFRVLDSNDNVVWQCYQLLVDIPPLTPTVALTLGKNSAWQNQVFVPLYNQGQTVIGPGDYTLEAEVLGSPAYSARSAFTVGVLVGGPIIPPTPLVK
jgi:hypothetical protein